MYVHFNFLPYSFLSYFFLLILPLIFFLFFFSFFAFFSILQFFINYLSSSVPHSSQLFSIFYIYNLIKVIYFHFNLTNDTDAFFQEYFFSSSSFRIYTNPFWFQIFSCVFQRQKIGLLLLKRKHLSFFNISFTFIFDVEAFGKPVTMLQENIYII